MIISTEIKAKMLNIALELDDNCIQNREFMNMIETKITVKDNIDVNHINYGLISLHSCGDLTPTMMKLFNHENKIKFISAFSCCYHSMKLNEGE